MRFTRTPKPPADLKLHVWNGPGQLLMSKSGVGTQHLFAAAYTYADLIALLKATFRRHPPDLEEYVRRYWTPSWGKVMMTVAVERAVWVHHKAGTLVERVHPLDTVKRIRRTAISRG